MDIKSNINHQVLPPVDLAHPTTAQVDNCYSSAINCGVICLIAGVHRPKSTIDAIQNDIRMCVKQTN